MSTKVIVSCDCGYVSAPTTPGRVAYSLKQHSCTRHITLAARAEHGVALRAAVDRTPKPCTHKIARHVHGQYSCYVLDRCRCIPCMTAKSDYTRAEKRAKAYGRWDNYVDAAPARDHVKSLTAQGMGLKRIVEVSDVSQGLLWKLIYGKRKNGRKNGRRVPSVRITKSAHARILAIDLDLAGGVRIDGTGTTRRIRALVAVGWSQAKQAQRVGMTGANFNRLALGKTDVTVATAKAVTAMYDHLWNTPPAHTNWRDLSAYNRAISYAALHGWVGPLAWDDDTIDNPATTPDLGDVNQPKTNGRPHKLDVETIEWLLDQEPFTLTQIADRLHVVRSAVEHACARHDRADLLTRMARNALVREMTA